MLQDRLGDCVKDIERLVMVVLAVMAIGNLELGGLGEAHRRPLVVDKVEVGSVLILLLAQIVLYLGAGHAVGFKLVVEVGDHHPMGVGSGGAAGRGGETGAKGQHQTAAEIRRNVIMLRGIKTIMSPHHLIPTRLLIDKLQAAILHVMIQTPRPL